MSVHPVVGAAGIAISHGHFRPYRPGWNLSSDSSGERYVWIDVEGHAGRTTNERPAGIPDSEIHRKEPEPDFFTSEASSLFDHALTALDDQLLEEESRTKIHQIHHQVREVARVSLNGNDAWDPRIVQCMQKSFREGLNMPRLSVVDMISPAKHVIGAYLDLAIPGIAARRMLASYLVNLVDNFPPPDPLEGRRVERLVALFLHLRNGVGILLRERAKYSLHSFYLMTYLAVLLGDAAMIVGRMLIDTVLLSEEQRTSVLRNQRMLDEEVTHSLIPTFLYPALFCNRPTLEVMLQTGGKTHVAQDFVYPQLDGTNATGDDPENVFRILLEKTASLPAYDVLPLLYGKGTLLLDEQNLQELMKFLIALSIGRGSFLDSV
jgi:hypothetical protein